MHFYKMLNKINFMSMTRLWWYYVFYYVYDFSSIMLKMIWTAWNVIGIQRNSRGKTKNIPSLFFFYFIFSSSFWLKYQQIIIFRIWFFALSIHLFWISTEIIFKYFPLVLFLKFPFFLLLYSVSIVMYFISSSNNMENELIIGYT